VARKPFRQGDLDGLCGLYTLVNAAKLVAGPISQKQGTSLFEQCLLGLNKKMDVARAVTEGVGVNRLVWLVRNVLEPSLPVTCHRPFAKASKVSLDSYWESIQDFLAEPRRTVVVCINGATFGHWTLVRTISPGRMEFFDSSGFRRVIRRHCTTGDLTAEQRLAFVPTATIFVKRAGQQG
jgi:hypothetical protein